MTKHKKRKQTILTHAKRIFVPHKGNEYRPHLIRWRGLTIVLAFVVFLQAGYSFITTGNVLGEASDISVSELLRDTNTERKKESMPALSLNEKLSEAAYLKARDMFENDYWAHTSPSGINPWKWFADAGYQYDVAGENLAKNYSSASATVDAWMASPAHRENILREDYKEVGFAVMDGILDDKPTVLVVAMYGSPIITQVAAAPATYAASIEQARLPVATYIGVTIQSLDPATIGTIMILSIVAIVAGITHHYRYKMPNSWKKKWKVHHGAYKMIGVIMLMILVVAGATGGQI